MANEPIKPPLFSLNWHDLIRGLILAVGTVLLTSLYPIIQAGSLPTVDQWKAISLAGVSSLIAYLLKNFFTNSSGQLAKPEPVKPV